MNKRFHALLSLAGFLAALILAGCASQTKVPGPLSWNNVQPGMQREQVHALLGPPTQADLGGPEEIYLYAVDDAHSELHVQYDASGTVCAKRYHYIE